MDNDHVAIGKDCARNPRFPSPDPTEPVHALKSKADRLVTVLSLAPANRSRCDPPAVTSDGFDNFDWILFSSRFDSIVEFHVHLEAMVLWFVPVAVDGELYLLFTSNDLQRQVFLQMAAINVRRLEVKASKRARIGTFTRKWPDEDACVRGELDNFVVGGFW